MKWFDRQVRGVLVPVAIVLTAQGGLAQSVRVSAADPAGWVGVTVQGPNDSSGETSVYPVITAVVPKSPADRAGLVAGDTILKYDKFDARTVLRFTRFLQPGRHIRVMVRRHGVRTVTVVVGKRPAEQVAWNFGNLMFATTTDSQPSFVVSGNAAFSVSLCPLTPIAAPATMLETTTLAGASLVQMNPDLAALLHTRNGGVLVLNVASGTSARQAGLKGGDVIVMVDASPVNTPGAVIRMVASKTAQDSDDLHLTLRVIRDGKARQITLRK